MKLVLMPFLYYLSITKIFVGNITISTNHNDARFIDNVEPNDDPKRTTGEFTFVLMKSLMKSV